MEDCLGLAMDASVKIVVNPVGSTRPGWRTDCVSFETSRGRGRERPRRRRPPLGSGRRAGVRVPARRQRLPGSVWNRDGAQRRIRRGGDRTGDRCLVGGRARHGAFDWSIDDLDPLGQTLRASQPPRSATATTTWSTGQRRSSPPGCSDYVTAAVRTGRAGARGISLLVIDTDTDGADLDAEQATAPRWGRPQVRRAASQLGQAAGARTH